MAISYKVYIFTTVAAFGSTGHVCGENRHHTFDEANIVVQL